ncbi:uncharacterized protein BDR25DRAFT_338892 [Lindgomyces ingoldianus]|uniref:Uncharacterized protein n=1 Tax=Lindgomyces ingoldianus TaxID=673940 RepID=A0ACB6RIE5_9PLEO|nr:uncharacterized protein BDR25DRAFT_338892 [Lindgomyces ingoldianus]KAF2478287.1 hypothetical protein BDR25DRAFT_338892 [Lindgomyces ingoldianus]
MTLPVHPQPTHNHRLPPTPTPPHPIHTRSPPTHRPANPNPTNSHTTEAPTLLRPQTQTTTAHHRIRINNRGRPARTNRDRMGLPSRACIISRDRHRRGAIMGIGGVGGLEEDWLPGCWRRWRVVVVWIVCFKGGNSTGVVRI